MQYRNLLTISRQATGTAFPRRFFSYFGTQLTAGGVALGVNRFKVVAGQSATIDVWGTTLVETGGGISLGDPIESDTLGRAVVFSTGAILARALSAASGESQIVEVLLLPRLSSVIAVPPNPGS